MSYLLRRLWSRDSDLGREGNRTFIRKYGQWAVVTGGSSGIGLAFARELACNGLNIVLVARRAELLQRNCEALEQNFGVKTFPVVADLSTMDGIRSVLEQTEKLDVGLLINNAGVAMSGPLIDSSEDEVTLLMGVNVTATVWLAREFAKRLAKRYRCEDRGGGIMLVSSTASMGVPLLSLYSSSKSFVTTLGLTLSCELSEYSVDVTVVEPGFVDTPMVTSHQSAASFGSWIMTSDECARRCIGALGRRMLYVPDLKYALIRRLSLFFLTRPLATWVLFLIQRTQQFYKSRSHH